MGAVELIISLGLCMIVLIEVLKTLIHGQTLWKLKVATCRITTFSLPTRATCGSVLTNPFPKIAGIRWLQVAMWLIYLCSLGFDLYYPHASLNHLSPIFDSDMHLMFLFAILHTQRKLHVCERLTHQQSRNTLEQVCAINWWHVVMRQISACVSCHHLWEDSQISCILVEV